MKHLDDTAPSPTKTNDNLRRLQTETGHYAMLALDQRESLRDMFGSHADGALVGDDELRAFKRAALSALTPHASGVLIDRLYSLADGAVPGLAGGCGVILAVDVLVHGDDRALTGTRFDDGVTVDAIHTADAAALKVLVLWRADSGEAEREATVTRTLELAERAGVATLIEGIARPPLGRAWAHQTERHEAILAAATELSAMGADLYKAEVPGYQPGDLSLVEAHSRELSRITPTDWVVLSNGVAAEDFASAVDQAIRGGGAGFLAGRAIWGDAPRQTDPAAYLRDTSVGRLQRLAALVDSKI